MKNSQRIIALIGMTFCTCCMLFILWLFVSNGSTQISRFLAATDWEKTTCTVNQARFEARRVGRTSTTYFIKGHFSYEVNGVTYQQSQFNLTDNEYTFKNTAKTTVAALTNNPVTACFYDPENPTNAVIDRQYRLPLYTTAGVLAFLIGLCWWLGFFSAIPRLLRHGS